jgi:hypothetical protein
VTEEIKAYQVKMACPVCQEETVQKAIEESRLLEELNLSKDQKYNLKKEIL